VTARTATPARPQSRRLLYQALGGIAAMCLVLLLVAGSDWAWVARAEGIGIAGGVLVTLAVAALRRLRSE